MRWFLQSESPCPVLRFLIGPSANLIFAQEVEEGNFREALMRLKHYKMEIAASRANEIEREGLYRPLHSVLYYQLRVVLWNFLITFTSSVQHCLVWSDCQVNAAGLVIHRYINQLRLHWSRYFFR